MWSNSAAVTSSCQIYQTSNSKPATLLASEHHSRQILVELPVCDYWYEIGRILAYNRHMAKRPAPISNVSGKYGAPMGRSDTLHPANPIKLHLAYVPFVDACYDQGGAYWGMPANLYVAWGTEDGEYAEFYCRAGSRDDAKRLVLEHCPEARFYR
jgi:hypothetical protein